MGLIISRKTGTPPAAAANYAGGGCWNEPPGLAPRLRRDFKTLAQSGVDAGTGSFPDKLGGSCGMDTVETNSLLRTHVVNYGGATGNQTLTDGFSIINVSDCPLPVATAMRATFAAQVVENGNTYTPGVIQDLGLTGVGHGSLTLREWYIRFAFRYSSNWWGHNTTTNKIMFLRSNTAFRIEPIIRTRGAGSNPLHVSVDLQGATLDPRNAVPPLGNLVTNNEDLVVRGQWHVAEAYLKFGAFDASRHPGGVVNTGSGKLRYWHDGRLIYSWDDVEYDGSDPTAGNGTRYWDNPHFNPTWGGINDTIPQTQTLDIAGLYVSGA